jgi:hypothetical protein
MEALECNGAPGAAPMVASGQRGPNAGTNTKGSDLRHMAGLNPVYGRLHEVGQLEHKRDDTFLTKVPCITEHAAALLWWAKDQAGPGSP